MQEKGRIGMIVITLISVKIVTREYEKKTSPLSITSNSPSMFNNGELMTKVLSRGVFFPCIPHFLYTNLTFSIILLVSPSSHLHYESYQMLLQLYIT
ncbi:hypothetical protein PISMIDRAFT_357802 [Pisolithus microcarpus 441]|uniref:Uncharacterized protein n=1 Tax=Pisolithus microcarpus 441 TaxID=765257 RepID=A0A0C9Z2N7_9AGAM|nr:hypothetical protein PISMIDRAFT_357802 [Pisolithus microcarpus 441]